MWRWRGALGSLGGGGMEVEEEEEVEAVEGVIEGEGLRRGAYRL